MGRKVNLPHLLYLLYSLTNQQTNTSPSHHDGIVGLSCALTPQSEVSAHPIFRRSLELFSVLQFRSKCSMIITLCAPPSPSPFFAFFEHQSPDAIWTQIYGRSLSVHQNRTSYPHAPSILFTHFSCFLINKKFKIFRLKNPKMPKKVTIIGSGNWGSAIARIIGENVTKYGTEFDKTVPMWVYEEIVNGRKLSEIINQQHENVKYLPGKKLPENVIAVTDIVEASKEADILVFVVPHQHVSKLCDQLKGKIKSEAIAISLIKGLSSKTSGAGIKLISDEIKEILGIQTAVLMGANLAPEVAEGNFCEATIGSKNPTNGKELKKLFHTANFCINVVEDSHTVELCGALKNIVACAAGFSDGLGFGDNTKAAVIRLGLMEMMRFIEHFYPGTQMKTFFESCGVADLITTCYGGRNRKVCEAFVKSKKPLVEVERELLNGQSAQGPLTAAELYETLKLHKVTEKFPLLVAVHKICSGESPPDTFIDHIRNHPEHGNNQNGKI